MIIRLGIGIALGVLVTAALFFLMQALIRSDRVAFTEPPEGARLDFLRLGQEQDAQRRERRPPPPPPVDDPPPEMPRREFDQTSTAIGMDIGAVDMSINPNLGTGGGFVADGEYLPIVQIAPEYPQRAAERGIEGYVLLEFTVTEAGTVENPVVIEAQPPGIFDRAALNTVVRYKYQPRVIDGEPVPVMGVRTRIEFQLRDEGRFR